MNASSALQGHASTARVTVGASRLQLTVGLVVLALGVRCLGITMRPLWLDETFSAWFASRSWHYLWTVVPTFEAHPPFYYSVLKLWIALFGEGAIALRSLSVLLGIASVPVVIAASFELEQLDPSGRPLLRASIAGFLAACSPMLVLLGEEARPYPLLVLAYAVAILGLLRLMREFAEGRAGEWSSWIIFALGSELTLWAHGLGLFYGACLAIALAPAWLKSPVSSQRIRRGTAVAAAVALLYLPCLLMILGRAHDWSANWLGWQPDMLLQLFTIYSVMRLTTLTSVAAAVLFLLYAKRAIQHAGERPGWNAPRAILLLWLGPPLISAAVSALFVPVFLTRTLAGTLIPAFLAIGGAAAHTSPREERRLLALALCISLFPSAVQTATRPAFERWDLVASYLARNVSPKDQVWLYPSDSALPLARTGIRIPAPLRYLPAPFPTLNASGPIRAGWPAMVSLTREQALKVAADPAARQARTIWLVTRQSGIFDPDDDMPAALGRVRKAGPNEEWGYISVRAFSKRD